MNLFFISFAGEVKDGASETDNGDNKRSSIMAALQEVMGKTKKNSLSSPN